MLIIGTTGFFLMMSAGHDGFIPRQSTGTSAFAPRIDIAASDAWLEQLERGTPVRFVATGNAGDSASKPSSSLPADIVPLPTLSPEERIEMQSRCRQLAEGCRRQLDDLLQKFDEQDPDQQRRWGEYDQETELFAACERAVAAGTLFVEANGYWRRVPDTTIFRMPWVRDGKTVWAQIVLRHADYPGVANSERFLAHQRAIAAAMVADRFNGKPYEERLALAERRRVMLRQSPGAPETQRFMSTEFPIDVELLEPEMLLRSLL
ncbi:MAG: hypothetical protein MUC36_23935 [Planctomycetes bacterium]|nr:hypothetical protein [Planctomycetota bacterium]